MRNRCIMYKLKDVVKIRTTNALPLVHHRTVQAEESWAKSVRVVEGSLARSLIGRTSNEPMRSCRVDSSQDETFHPLPSTIQELGGRPISSCRGLVGTMSLTLDALLGEGNGIDKEASRRNVQTHPARMPYLSVSVLSYPCRSCSAD
jgi:hypothetical protein